MHMADQTKLLIKNHLAVTPIPNSLGIPELSGGCSDRSAYGRLSVVEQSMGTVTTHMLREDLDEVHLRDA
jgi:hypothetical protein